MGVMQRGTISHLDLLRCGTSIRPMSGWGQNPKGVHKISHANERLLLILCLRQARANYRYVLALYRRAVAAANAREELANMPRHRPLTRPGGRRTVF